MSESTEASYCAGAARQNARLLQELAHAAGTHADCLKLWPKDAASVAAREVAEITRSTAAQLSELEGLRASLLSWASELGLDDVADLHAEDVLKHIRRSVE